MSAVEAHQRLCGERAAHWAWHMLRAFVVGIVLIVALAAPSHEGLRATADELTTVLAEFEQYTGVRLVFEAGELPPGRYHDRMPALSPDRQLAAAQILIKEAHKLPRGYLRAI